MPLNRAADWFEHLVGFRETEYAATQRQLKIEGSRLHSLVNGQSYGIGILLCEGILLSLVSRGISGER